MPKERDDHYSERPNAAERPAPKARVDDSWIFERPRPQVLAVPVKAGSNWGVRILGLLPRVGFASSHLVGILFFCLPWVDVTCTKNKTGTVFQGADRVEQSGLQMTYGGVTRYKGPTKTTATDPKLAAPTLFIYAGCLLLGAAVAVVPWHRWRAWLALIFSLGAILALAIQAIIGFPIIEAAGSKGLWSLNAGITWIFLAACLANAAAFLMAGTDMLLALFVFKKPSHPARTKPIPSASG